MTVRPRTVATAVGVLVLVAFALLAARSGDEPIASPAADRSSAPTGATAARASRDPESGLAWVDYAELPQQARQTIALIEQGGPFPYAKDGVVFENRQHLLPARSAGYYHEYTVPTPGSSDRGARRIVAGDGHRQLFYTGDHYATFVRVRR